MSTSRALPKDDPRIRHWERYRRTDEYQNSWNWAADTNHRTGSMWAAFLAGWTMATDWNSADTNAPDKTPNEPTD